MALVSHARPIPDVLRDEKTPPRIRRLLAEITAVKTFGEKNGLKPTSNYQDYVQLDRPSVVWAVSACKPLEFKSQEWHFPIVGSFPYLGWFHHENAKNFAQSLRAEGWDVDVRGVGAYSTLGWFRDAVLSTMISEGPDALGDLVNVVLHESVHATVYIAGQSVFNESLASFVADHLTVSYLDQFRGPESDEKQSYLKRVERWRQMQARLHAVYLELEKLYAGAEAAPEKLERKKHILSQAQSELHLKADVNNATLVQYKTYSTGGQEFDRLLHACGSDWSRFIAAAKALSGRDFAQSQMQDLNPTLLQAIKSCQGHGQ
jgi:predicted aminopeptidase